MPRESSKCRKWEKDRRDRLNDGFLQLSKLLPCYDPSVNICKVDILQKAAANIEDLQNKIKKILSSDKEKKTETEDIIKKLQDRVKKLLVRNEQLSNLLRDAGISVPSAYGTIKKFKNKPLWSRRISPEQAKFIQKTEMEKENICSNSISEKKKKAKTTTSSSKRQLRATHSVGQKGVSKKRKNKKNVTSNCFIVLSQLSNLQQDVNQQCYLVTPQPSNNTHKNIKTGTTTSEVFSKPIVITSKTRTSKNILENDSIMPVLSPGTLVLAHGTIMRILPYQHQTFQPAISNSLINSVISVPFRNCKNQDFSKTFLTKINSATSIQCNGINKFPNIRPKYCLTKTTQVNKVPIPALTSRYANNNLLFTEPSVKQHEEKKKTEKGDQKENSSKTVKQASTKRKIEIESESVSNDKKRKIDLAADKFCESSTSNSNTIDCVDKSISESNDKVEDDISKAIKNGNESMKETPTDASKEDPLVEQNITQKVPLLKDANITEKLINPDNIEKLQKALINDNNISTEETLVVSTTVTTTDAIRTTTTTDVIKNLDLNISHSELSNDLFASLQVPSGCQNPESTSPTAAFLMAFPLVSSGVKVTEVIEEENSNSQRGTPTLLQIGTMESTKSTQSHTETITSNFLNLDSFSFIPSKELCSNFYTNYSSPVSKPNKIALPTSSISTNKGDATVNKSIYVNVKSPCLPHCVSEPVKENYNIFDLKSANSSKVIDAVDNCEKKNQNEKVSNNIDFNSQNQSSSKTNSNCCVLPKDRVKTSSDQKSQYCIPPAYSNTPCNLNYKNEASKLCTNSYANIARNYTNPLYTNCSNYSYSYPESNFNQTYYKNMSRNETKSYYPLNYENYPDYRKNESSTLSGYYDTTYIKDSRNNNVNKAKTNQNKLPINWMTTPDTRLQNSECLLNSFSKSDFIQTYPFSSYVTSTSTYFTSTSTDTSNVSCIMEAKKCLELPSTVSLNPRLDTEDKQFPWSPTKLPPFLDHPHNFVTSTLPTLVGDLALGNNLSFGEQKSDYKYLKENKNIKRNNRNGGYENQSNFLSVSQLVDHNKPENVPAKTSIRRNSGNRSKNNVQQKIKRGSKHDIKDAVSNCGINGDKICERIRGNYNALTNNEVFSDQKNRSATKNTSSNYSAEALIGNQGPDESVHKRYPPSTSKSLGTSGFLTENIISYFPPVDLAQDNYMPQSQNYQANNFTHDICASQPNTYSSNSFIYAPSTITSTYLPSNNFETGHNDYLPDNLVSNTVTKEKHYNNVKSFNNRQQPNKDEKSGHTVCQTNFKKSKKKQPGDINSTLTGFEFPFLSIPGSNNSPILPDDFHCHTNFLPPTTPFPCKNSLYTKQNDLNSNPILPLPSASRSNAQHPEISPSINSVGTSLTNFNLSTIFPEINKGPITEIYSEARGKEQSKSCTSSSPQVPFDTEPKFSFSS